MLICGQNFNFSALNANDLDRFEDAMDEMTRASEAETARCERENVRLGDRLRAQARICMCCLDSFLGEGASARLGLDENDASRIYDVVDEVGKAIDAEKKRFGTAAPVPQNRAQRRAMQHGKLKPPVSYPAAQPAPASQMVGRVEDVMAARNAVKALQDDPAAMMELAEAALRIASERGISHV